MKKVTIQMVAEHAGVSRGTVDRVLNQRPHVGYEQRERVLRAMKELNYIPTREKQFALLGLDAPGDQKKTVIGIILSSEGGYFQEEISRGINDAVNSLRNTGTEVLVEKCDTRMPDELADHAQRMVEKGAGGLAVCAENEPQVHALVNELAEKGITVVTYNSDLPGSRRAFFIGEDVLAGGRLAGELMAKFLEPGDGLIVAVGNEKVDAHTLRLRGFCEKMYSHGFRGEHMHIIETYNDYMLTKDKVGEILRNDPGIRGIYMANHSVGGCASAVRAERPGQRIRIICHDLTGTTKRLLKSGEVEFAITQNLYNQGYGALMTLQGLVINGSVPKEYMQPSDMRIICAENIGI